MVKNRSRGSDLDLAGVEVVADKVLDVETRDGKKTKMRARIIEGREDILRKQNPTAAIIQGYDDIDHGVAERQLRKSIDDVGFDTSSPKTLPSQRSIITPPAAILYYSNLHERSSILGPLIDTMVTNVHGFGWDLKSLRDQEDVKNNPDLQDAVLGEEARLRNLFNNINPKLSMTKLRKKTGNDRYATGNAYWEILRNKSRKEEDRLPTRANYVPAASMRLCKIEKALVDAWEYQRTISYERRGTEVVKSERIERVKTKRRFRRFVQVDRQGKPKVWFKEYGDPRPMNRETGSRIDVPRGKEATEIYHFASDYTRNGYGLPPWAGALIILDTDRASDEIVFVTLNNNNVPSMIIMVSDGYLSEDSVNRVTEFVEDNILGKANRSRFLILEAEPSEDSGGMGGIGGGQSPKISTEKLTDVQMNDDHFEKMHDGTYNRTRLHFRVSPVFQGDSGGFNRSTALIGRRMSDEQAFDPDRREFDEDMDFVFLRPQGAVHHQYESKTTNITDERDIIDVAKQSERSGAMTPRIMHGLLEKFLGRKLPLPTGIDLDRPYSAQLAELTKNQGPSEPGTTSGAGASNAALKSLVSDFGDDSLEELRHILVEAMESRAIGD